MFKPGDEYFDFEQGELLLADKPERWTSFTVVNRVKRAIGLKTGHGGTLDPLATGLMILGTGRQTKKLHELIGLDKSYIGSICLGAVTPSYDLENEPHDHQDISHLSAQDVIAAAQKFTGTIEQMPPIFSAVKLQGKKAYELARKGKTPDIQPRQVTIYDFVIEQVQLPMVYFSVSVSKGTYIRSLAHDLGQALGVGGYLSSLRRTCIGPYSIEEAWEMEPLLEALKRQKARKQEQDADH